MSRDNETAPASLEQTSLICPITALAFFQAPACQPPLVLAGEDTWLAVFDSNRQEPSTQPLARLKVFAEQSVHGIHVSGSRALVWGGHSVALASVDILLAGKHPAVEEARAPDWIYDASLSPADPRRGVLVTAHNEVVPLSVVPGGGGLALHGVIASSRPILYSAAVAWTGPAQVLVASGTVFGEILVWRCDCDARTTRTLYVLTGHEGSIFGVAISPEVQLENGSGHTRWLASCSDDRTIRVWDISTDGNDSDGKEYSSKMSELARQTGFGAVQDAEAAQNSAASRCLAVAMGHASRIWHVKFDCRDDSPVKLYSFGEDGTAQKWAFQPDPGARGLDRSVRVAADRSVAKPSGELLHLQTIPCHSGKHIWSCATKYQQDGSPLIATGGADGKISLLGWNNQVNRPNPGEINGTDKADTYNYADLSLSLSMEDVLSQCRRQYGMLSTNHLGKPEKDSFCRYVFITDDHLLATTVSGRLIRGTASDELTFVEIDVPQAIKDDLRAYSAMQSPGSGVVFLGSGSGRLYAFSEAGGIQAGGIQQIYTVTGKITSIMCLPGTNSDIDPSSNGQSINSTRQAFTLLVSVFGSSQATLLDVIITDGGASVHATSIVELEKDFVPTAATLCGSHLVLGSRFGAIAIYQSSSAGPFTHLASRRDTTTRDGVSSILPLPPLPDGQPANTILATFRDGKYRIYTLSPTLRLRHETSPPLGPMLEGAFLSGGAARDLVLFGFRGTRFVVWNETQRAELASVECGGAHRPFGLAANPAAPEMVRFACTKAGQLVFYSQARKAVEAVRRGVHGRDIHAAAMAAGGRYLATGAEDTRICIWEEDGGGGGGGRRCVALLERHLSGIQCLQWFGDDVLVSSGGNEELFVWRVTRLESEYKGLAVVCEAVYRDRKDSGDLRITDFDIVSSEDGEEGMKISMVFSNSVLETYRYVASEGFRMLAQGKYTGCCLTKIQHLQPLYGNVFLLTASTNGHVVIWDDFIVETTGTRDGIREYRPIISAKIHQSSIKCLDIRKRGANIWLIVTGGDDNALGVLSLLYDDDTGQFSILGKGRASNAHAAAITGVAILEMKEETTIIASVSNDQRIKLWRLEETGGGRFKISLIDCRPSAIADPGVLETLGHGKLLVAGIGMEEWSWSTT